MGVLYKTLQCTRQGRAYLREIYMPYFEVDQAVIDGLDEEVKAKFAAYEPEDVSGLKTKANEALNEAKTAKAERKSLEAQIATLESNLAEAKLNKPAGDSTKLQEQLDDANRKLADKEQSFSQLQESITQNQIKSEAARIAAGITKDTTKAGLLAEKLSSRLAFDEGSIKVLDADGKLTVSSTDDLVGEFKESFPFLVDGSPAQGGGAAGNKAGGGSAEKTIGRTDFDKMDHVQRAEFAKGGGKVINE